MRVAIVGAGLSGLATAALLARRDHDVVVLEATKTLGGLAAPVELGPHRFCPGPQYLWGMATDGPGSESSRRRA
jgi:phytoene dehydrogenase-like protein